jgi:ABC-2 type transport system permease protein
MNGEERLPQSFSWARRWSAGLNLIITVAAVLSIVAMLNYLAIRHYKRFHLSKSTETRLSNRTLTVLGSLTNTVKVIVYFDSSAENSLFPRVRGLLKEYQNASPRLDIQYVDYLRDVGAARLIKEQYKLESITDKDVIIFDSHGGKKVVNAGELSDYDYSKLVAGETNEVYRTNFKGEMLFTSAIFAVANERRPLACFLLGNGEHSPAEGEAPDGYAKFASALVNENNFEVRPLLLGGTNDVPANCSLLIVSGPTQPLDRTALDAIQRYLEQGGRMLVAFNSMTVRGRPTGLERLLGRWGVEVDDNIVYDPANSQNNGFDVIPVELGKHPIVNGLQNSRLQLLMPRSIRALRPLSRNDDVKVDELLFTGLETAVRINPRTSETDPSQKGPKSLAVVVEKSVPGLQRGSTRIVVIGDSMLWGNGLIANAANREFGAFAANWLVSQSLLLQDIPPRPIHNFKLTMTRAQLRSVQLVLLVGLPGAALLIGFVVWTRRRH